MVVSTAEGVKLRRKWARLGLPAGVSTLLAILTGLLTNLFTAGYAIPIGLSLGVVVIASIGWEWWRATRTDTAEVVEKAKKAAETVEKEAASAVEAPRVHEEPMPVAVSLTSQLRRSLDGPASSVAYSPDGRRLVTASAGAIAPAVRVWDATTGARLKHLRGHQERTTSAAWSPDGRLIASTGDDMTTRLWDTESGRCIRVLSTWPAVTRSFVVVHWTGMATLYRGQVSTATFAPDGRQVATGSGDGRIRIWDVDTGNSLHVLTPHAGVLLSAAWSRQGRLATGSADKTARIWDMTNKTIDLVLEGHTGPVRSVAWSVDGSLVATASQDRSARVWDAATGKCVEDLIGHTRAVGGVAWSPDGIHLATCGDDKTVRIWETDSGLCHTIPYQHRMPRGVAWSPEGRFLAIATSTDTQIHEITWRPGKLRTPAA